MFFFKKVNISWGLMGEKIVINIYYWAIVYLVLFLMPKNLFMQLLLFLSVRKVLKGINWLWTFFKCKGQNGSIYFVRESFYLQEKSKNMSGAIYYGGNRVSCKTIHCYVFFVVAQNNTYYKISLHSDVNSSLKNCDKL